MTQLSRLAIVGIGKESPSGTYATPTAYVPFTKADFSDDITELKDNSIRANDSMLQGVYGGPIVGNWSLELLAYPDLLGYFLMGMIGPDAVTPGVSTTSSGATVVGATTLPSTQAIPVGSWIQVDTAANLEYAKVTATSGSGPYNLTVTTQDSGAVGLQKAHASGTAIVSQTTHTFKQVPNVQNPTLSITVYDTLNTLGYPWAAIDSLQIKVDPKASVSLSAKFVTLPGVAQPAMTPNFTALPPLLGWQWLMNNAGAASTRGLSLDLTMKRPADPVHSSDGTQGPREIFQGAIDVDGTYKAIFENMTDLNLYQQYLQTPSVATLQQPTPAGGASLALTMSKSAYFKGARDWSGNYVDANFSLSGVYNGTDGGSIAAVLKNFRAASY